MSDWYYDYPLVMHQIRKEMTSSILSTHAVIDDLKNGFNDGLSGFVWRAVCRAAWTTGPGPVASNWQVEVMNDLNLRRAVRTT